MKLESERTGDHPDSLATVLITDFMSTTDSVTDMLKSSLNKINDFDTRWTFGRTGWLLEVLLLKI